VLLRPAVRAVETDAARLSKASCDDAMKEDVASDDEDEDEDESEGDAEAGRENPCSAPSCSPSCWPLPPISTLVKSADSRTCLDESLLDDARAGEEALLAALPRGGSVVPVVANTPVGLLALWLCADGGREWMVGSDDTRSY
jgi:hypothetical protein